MSGSHGWTHEWMGTVSVSGFQLSTCRGGGRGGPEFTRPTGGHGQTMHGWLSTRVEGQSLHWTGTLSHQYTYEIIQI